MATRMGAPGVRIELHDRSGYSLVESPNAVAGVVGFAPRGELNKIQLLTNTAQQDTYFGLGFNNSRYNQGMYAARAVLNAGGNVEFVRPYGEEIDRTDDFKRDLKTDTYVVSFDRNAVNNPENPAKTSMKIDFFASTRYKTDGAAKYGVTRKINNAAETIVNNSNVNFNVDAADDVFSVKKNYVSKGGSARGETDMVMFALMNADPSGANRAYTSFSLDTDQTKTDHVSTGELTVVTKGKVGFAVDDIVYGPAAGKATTLSTFRVTNIEDKTVTIKAEDAQTLSNVSVLGYRPATLLYHDDANAVSDGYDYLTVKTAVTGQGAKTFGSLHLDDAGLTKLKAIPGGASLAFRDEDANDVYVRVATAKMLDVATLAGTSATNITVTVSTDNAKADAVWVGDTVSILWPANAANAALYKVTGKDETGVTFQMAYAGDGTAPAGILTAAAWKIDNTIPANWVDSVGTQVLAVTSESTVASVTNDIVGIMRGEDLGYGQANILGDIAKDSTGKLVISEDKKSVKLAQGGALDFVTDDIVAITRASVDLTLDTDTDSGLGANNILWLGKVRTSDPITDTVEFYEAIESTVLPDTATALEFQLLNLTQTNKVVYASTDTCTKPVAMTVQASTETYTCTKKSAGSASPATAPVYNVTGVTFTATSSNTLIKVGTKVTASIAGVAGTCTGEVTAVNGANYTVSVTGFSVDKNGTHSSGTDVPPTGLNLVSNLKAVVVEGYSDIYMVGNYTVMVPVNVQSKTPAVDTTDNLFVATDGNKVFKYLEWTGKDGSKLVIDRSEKVLTDSTIGSTFVGLGLANLRYIDVNFTGNTVKVYDLTDEGEAVARLYLSVSYMYNGVLYEFDGTVVKYVYNDMQLYIGDTAESELEGSGVYFVLNDSGVMEMFREDNSYDLSATVAGEVQADGSIKAVPSSTAISPAFNTEDPAIVNNAVWTYDPLKNMSTSTISNAFNLFLDKDKSDVTFFVGAGLGLNNFGLKGYETLNTQLMQAILNICELRKDCFALFDGVADSRIEKVLKLDSPASRFGSTLGRWGAIYDARPIFYDSIVTKSNVEIAPSIPMASLITANRAGSVFWNVPAGEDTGMIPGAWCRKLKYERKFNYPEDPESDIARLCDIHVNPFRSNKKGIYCYGDFTMQMEDTAFNAINVTMLVAGIHKMFYNYLDSKVFRINTTALRAQISGDLQTKLDQFMAANPAGLDAGSQVICDDTNNPPEVIEAHKLFVDLMLYPTTSTRYIYLRTNVLSRANGNVISTDISTGAR